MVSAFAAAVLVLGGSLLLYAAAPNQRLTARRWPPRPLVAAGIVVLAVALALLLTLAGRATAVFIWLTAAMMVWTIAPVIAAWLRRTS